MRNGSLHTIVHASMMKGMPGNAMPITEQESTGYSATGTGT